MINYEFSIPISRDDLLKKSSEKQYIVENLIIFRHLGTKLKVVESQFRSEQADLILSSFDFFFSVLISFNQTTPEIKESSWKLLLKILNSEINLLVPILDSKLSTNEKLKHLNIIKMVCYLLCQFGNNFETSAQNDSATLNMGKGKKKLAVRTDHSETIDWDQEREAAIKVFLQLMQLNINKLWDPPIVEEDFVNLIVNFSYKLLENAASCRNKVLKDSTFNLIGIMVKRHCHMLGCVLKILQLLQDHEHLVSPLAQAVDLIAGQLEVKGFVSEIMRELGKLDAEELTKDSSGTKAFSVFLAELGHLIPSLILPNLCLVLPFLDMKEPYTMRNSVLSVMGDIIIKVLNGEELDAKQKKSRDQMLDRLEDHIIDVNAFVRSKVLQIWQIIVAEKALPLPRRQNLLVSVKGRIEDKSCLVRKQALQLIIALIKQNPLTVQFTPEELTLQYNREKSTLEEMISSNTEQTSLVLNSEEKLSWDLIVNKLFKTIVSYNKDNKINDCNDSIDDSIDDLKDDLNESTNCRNNNLIGENESLEGVKKRLIVHLNEGKFKDGIKLYKTMIKVWPLEINDVNAIHFSNDDGSEDDDEDDVSMKMLNGIKRVYLGEYESAATPMIIENHNEMQEPVNELSKQKILVLFLKESLKFVTDVYETVPLACEMLRYKSTTDVIESINYFISGFECGMSVFLVGIKKMIFLIHSKEPEIKEAIIKAYRRIYLSPSVSNPRQESITMATSIITLAANCEGIGDSDSLEELIGELVKCGDISVGVIQVLWEKFTLKMPGTSPQEAQNALNLIGMVASTQMKQVSSNLDKLISEGLGPRAEESNLFARDACKVIIKLCIPPAEMDASFRLPPNHEIFTRLSHLLITSYQNIEESDWIPFADIAILLIYKLADHPEEIAENLILQMARPGAQNLDITLVNECNATNLEDANALPAITANVSSMSPTLLSRFLFAIGHIALNQFEHLDVAVFAELKRRHKLREMRHNSKGQKDGTGAALSASTSRIRSKNKHDASSTTVEEEMGMGGVEVDDAEADFIRSITEKQIVTNEESLLGGMASFVVNIVSDQCKYKQKEVQASAILALAKFMITSSEFCELHLPLLFTLLEKSSSDAVKCNIIMSLGDLMYRMPNLIEPWTANIYARLHDENLQVRRTTIMVLTGLILHDMIKVKGQVSELGICLLDDDHHVATVAKHFFAEFSKKTFSIYNILPDVISRLSDEVTGVEEDQFRIILRHLISYIQKEKQSESLVEKLCQRFRTTVQTRGWRDIAFCISLLPSNEKSLKKLQENFSCFRDKLAEEFVYECFQTTIANAKSFMKPNTKVLIDEFEQKIEEARNTGVENEEVVRKANVAKPRTNKKSSRASKIHSVNMETDSNNDDDDEKVEPQPQKRTTRGLHSVAKPTPKLVFSSDEEELESEEDVKDFVVNKKKASKPSVNLKKKTNQIVDDDDDDD